MDANEFHNANFAPTAPTPSTGTRSFWTRLAGMAVFSTLVVSSATLPADAAAPAADAVESAPTFSRHVASFPDEIAAHVGGAAARLRVNGDAAVPGDLFVLFASDGSDDHARLYDQTPYALVSSHVHPEMRASMENAAAVVGEIVGRDIPNSDFTSAPGGGYSAGVTFAVGYLNMMSDGAFTGGLRVAATGSMDEHGYLDWVSAIDEKTAAAHLAGAEVMFTSTTPAFSTIDEYATRFAGDPHGTRRTGAPLAEERGWDHYQLLGEQRPVDGMDVVAVAHLGDVAAYLCGAGSEDACTVRAAMDDVTIGSARSAAAQAPAAGAQQAAAHGNLR
jgi:hypothetical protein